MNEYFSADWATRFGEGLSREWRLTSLRHPVPIVLHVTDGKATLAVTAARNLLKVEASSSAPVSGSILAARPEVWDTLFTDEWESLTRLIRQGHVRLEGDRGATMLRWRIVFAIVEAMALTVRGEL